MFGQVTLRVWVVLAVFAFMVACGSDGGASGSGGDLPSVDSRDGAGNDVDAAGPFPDSLAPPSDASGPAGLPIEFTVQLPSDVAGAEGLAVSVMAPHADHARYAQGAPVAVTVMGGWSLNSPAKVDPKLVEHGVVSVGWLFPGAATVGQQSGGTFDVRGPLCQRALADVLLYAAGKKSDSGGKTLLDRVPHALTSEVGLVAGSNGGNLALTTLADHESELADVDWLVAWESPIGDQQANVELNGNDDYVPGSCTATSCMWGESFATHLSWDPSLQTSARHDTTLTEMGRLVSSAAPSDAYAQMPSGIVDGELYMYPSQELAGVLRDNQQAIFGPAGPPSWLVLNAADVTAYWHSRDGALRIAEVHEAFSDLLVMHLQRVDDHVQKQPDYPHATAHLLGWNDVQHAWFRLNPDAAYQAHALPGAGQTYPENDAGVLVQFPGAENQMVPNVIGNELQLAGVLELADRTHVGDTRPDLDAVLVDFTPSGRGSGPPGGGSIPQCDEGRKNFCCGDGVCGGPENATNCPQDC